MDDGHGDDEEAAAPDPDSGLAPGSTPRGAPKRRDAVLTVALVSVLLVVVAAIVTLDLRPQSGSDQAPTAAAPSATPTAGGTEPASPPSERATDDDRLPDRKPEDPAPTSQAEPPPLPTLAALDRRLARSGFVRVPDEQLAGLEFTVATFNVLGASHTRGRDARRGYASGEQRLGPQLAAMAAKGVGVAGTQEFQQDQVRALARRGGDWAIFPGLELGPRLADNSIVWRDSLWERMRTRTTPVPYFSGNLVPMPQVLLRHRETGRQVWFANFHNPADSRGNAAGFRQRAVEIEAALARRLSADGTPVILTGDMNDRERFACPFSRLSGMSSADGARTRNGRCITPRGMFVDWIWGTPDLRFTDFVADRSIEARRLSDHPLITSTVTLPGVAERRGCRQKIARQGLVWYCRT